MLVCSEGIVDMIYSVMETMSHSSSTRILIQVGINLILNTIGTHIKNYYQSEHKLDWNGTHIDRDVQIVNTNLNWQLYEPYIAELCNFF